MHRIFMMILAMLKRRLPVLHMCRHTLPVRLDHLVAAKAFLGSIWNHSIIFPTMENLVLLGGGRADLPQPLRICVYACVYAYT